MGTSAPRRPAAPTGGSLTGVVRSGFVSGLPSVQRQVRRRRRLFRSALAGAVVLVVVLLLATSGGGAKGSGAGGVSVQPTLAAKVLVPGPAAGAERASDVAGAAGAAGAAGPASSVASGLPWPATGQGAVAIPAVGYTADSGPEKAVPVASLTKIMTAYVILHDHPLAAGAQGPGIAITTTDAWNFGTDTVTDQASVELQAGEVLTEYQLLEGLLVHSANDFAYALAMWDAGSVNAFVAKMNATAATLGMRATHFADASGFSSGSMSTAADLLRVASDAMTLPAFAAIVKMPSVSLPVAGTVSSYTPLVGTTPGVVGVKSGFTTAAGGGDVLAYQASVGGTSFVVLAAVTSQEGPTVLETAGKAALSLAQAAAGRVEAFRVAGAGQEVGRVTAAGRTIALRTTSAATVLAMAGDAVHQSAALHAPRAGARAGTTVGAASYRLGSQVVTVPVATEARMP